MVLMVFRLKVQLRVWGLGVGSFGAQSPSRSNLTLLEGVPKGLLKGIYGVP